MIKLKDEMIKLKRPRRVSYPPPNIFVRRVIVWNDFKKKGAVNENEGYNSCVDEKWGFDNQNDCLSDIDGLDGFTCEQGTIPVYNSCADDYSFDAKEKCEEEIDGWGERYSATCEQNTIDVALSYEDFIAKPLIYNSCSETGKNVCLRYTVENNRVEGADVCFIKNGTEHCLQGWTDESSLSETPIYNSNKLVIQSVFNESNYCGGNYTFSCNSSDWYASTDPTGFVVAHNNNFGCNIFSNTGFAYCYVGDGR